VAEDRDALSGLMVFPSGPAAFRTKRLREKGALFAALRNRKPYSAFTPESCRPRLVNPAHHFMISAVDGETVIEQRLPATPPFEQLYRVEILSQSRPITEAASFLVIRLRRRNHLAS
jgi:hypothetical protein